MAQRRSFKSHPIAVASAFQQAVALHEEGRLWEAEQLYEQVLRVDRNHFGSLCRLGILRLQQSRFYEAVRLFRRAIEVDGNSADAHHSLACALMAIGKPLEAIRHHEKAIAIRPQFAEALNNLGQALQMLGRVEEAIAQYRSALKIRSAYPEAYNNLGNALHLSDQSEAAINEYGKALAINPNYAEAHWNMGNALRALNRLEAAIQHYAKALAIKPHFAEAHTALGDTLRMLDRPEAAIEHYEKAIAIRRRYLDPRIKLGEALEALGRFEEAIGQYDGALAIKPNCVEALNNRGTVLFGLKRYDDALSSFEQALATDPDNSPALNGVARAVTAACDWTGASEVSGELAARVAEEKAVVDPFTFLAYCSDPALQLKCARTFVRNGIRLSPLGLWNRTVWQNEKIHIAYVASGFHEHPTAYLTTELLELHDRSRFKILGISLGPDDKSHTRARLIKTFDEFYDVRSQTATEIAKLVKDLRVDIAVDRSGYTQSTRPEIFHYRSAPIQVSYIGFPGTMGAECYDYVIADRIVLPFDQQAFYIEKIVHLPDCYLASDSKRVRVVAHMPTRQDVGLPEKGFVFCCFNNSFKITPCMFDIWMRLLRAVDGSVLWLLSESSVTEANLRREARCRGIDSNRLIFAPWLNMDAHLIRHRLADLFLDTLPYNAHTTASDALWAGLPLITCRGKSFAGRVAASLLSAIGLSELITEDLATYETLALQLATQPSLLWRLRERLEQHRLTYPLFDTDRYRRNIESAYTQMWQMWQRGENPRSFSVETEPHHPGTGVK